MLSTWTAVMVHCGLLVCMVTSIAQNSAPPPDSCREIGQVLTEKFQKHSHPTHVQNLFTCQQGVTCCNTISEYLFQHNVEQEFTTFALYTVNRRLTNFKDGMYAQQVNWETFSSLIEQVEDGLQITYEHFFELALLEIIAVKQECLRRPEVKQLKKDSMSDIVTLVNNIYAYQKGVEAINVTLQATASLQPSKHCSTNVTRAGIPLDLQYRPAGCPLCLDSTSQIKVCRDLCINIVRGCYASILQYKALYLELVQKMDQIYFTLNYHLEMQNGSLFTFINKIEKHLKKKDFAEKCSPPYDGKRKKKRAAQGPDLRHFEEYFSKQLSLESAIVDPATLPCAGSHNTPPCWNGRQAGSYKHIAFAYVLDEQEINPEGADLELSEYQLSAVNLMRKALILANRTANDEHLFPILRAEVEGTTEPPPIPLHHTVPQILDKTDPKPLTVKPNTYRPIKTIENNNVEPTTVPSTVETNARGVHDIDAQNSHSSLSVNNLTLIIVVQLCLLLMAR